MTEVHCVELRLELGADRSRLEAGPQVGGHRDFALAVQSVDLRRAIGDRDACHVAEVDRVAVLVADNHVRDCLRVAAVGIGKLNPDVILLPVGGVAVLVLLIAGDRVGQRVRHLLQAQAELRRFDAVKPHFHFRLAVLE